MVVAAATAAVANLRIQVSATMMVVVVVIVHRGSIRAPSRSWSCTGDTSLT